MQGFACIASYKPIWSENIKTHAQPADIAIVLRNITKSYNYNYMHVHVLAIATNIFHLTI